MCVNSFCFLSVNEGNFWTQSFSIWITPSLLQGVIYMCGLSVDLDAEVTILTKRQSQKGKLSSFVSSKVKVMFLSTAFMCRMKASDS